MEVPTEVITAVLTAVSSGGAAWVYFRRQLSELHQREEDHTEGSYKRVINTMRTRIDELALEVSAQSARQRDLQNEHDECTDVANRLRMRVATLETELELVRRRVGAQLTRFTVRADKNDIVTDISEGVEHVLGWRPTKVIGRSLNMFVSEDQRAIHDEASEAAIARGDLRPFAIRCVALHRDGRLVPVTIAIDRLLDDTGNVIGVSANVSEDQDELSATR